MSRRFWRFAVAALFGTVFVAALLAVFNNYMVKQQLIELGAENNMILIRSLSNSLRPQLDQLLSSEHGFDYDKQGIRPEIRQFQSTLDSQIENLSVVNVKVYNKQGLTVFSTRPEQIGVLQSANPGFISASKGVPVSELVYSDHLHTYEKVGEDQNLIHSYLSLRDDMNAIKGVFEIYTEVTPLLYRIRESQQWIMVAVIGVLGIFYVVLVVAYARSDRAQQREQKARQNHLREIERQVKARTRDLEESRSFLQTVMDGMSDALMVIDKEFRVTSMNQAARAFVPADRDPDEQLYCYRVTHHRETPCDGVDHGCSLKEVLKTGQPRVLVHTHYLPNNEPRKVEVMVSPLRNVKGEITGVIEVNHDITERELLQSELIQARDAAERASITKSEFVASMSHEIRTPMNAVIGMTDLLLQTRLTRKQQEYIQVVKSSGDMLLSVVDSILDFSQLEAGALSLEKNAINVTELLDSVLEMMGYQAYSKGLELVGLVTIPDPELIVSGDSGRLRQILVNLASNAIKFTEQGQVVLRVKLVSENDGQVVLRFEVKDSGIGIDQAAQEQLFEPYTRINSPSVNPHGGTGLGLTICKQLVVCMGGEIGVDSEPGQGSSFWFNVTLDKVAETDISLDRSGLKGLRVLVVDDHPDVLNMLCYKFSSWGMSCECLSNTSEVQQCLEKVSGTVDAFDIAVIDANMPGNGGLSLARRIREDTVTADLPMLLLCSVANPLYIGTVTSLTRTQCIHKPILASRLYEMLMEVTHREEVDKKDAGDSHSESIPISHHSEHILVAEDNPFSKQLLLDMLDSLGYQADSAVDGPGVLDAMEDTSYDIIFMDSQMPGMNGAEVTRHIRDHRSRYPIQPLIIAISADVSQHHREACLEAGMDEFINKPVRLEKLTAGLQRWLPESSLMASSYTDTTSEPTSLCGSVCEAPGENEKKDQTFQEDYIKLFLEDAYARLKIMKRALDGGEHEQLSSEAHALEGSCMQLGNKSLYESCNALHEAANNGQTEIARERWQHLSEELNHFDLSQATESGLLSTASTTVRQD